MIAIRIVVCPVDFSPATTRQVDLAVDVCRTFGARLVLHHNVTDVSVGAAVGWMWHAAHDAVVPPVTSVDDQLRAVVGRVPDGIDVETCITRGGVSEAVLAVCEAAEADLIVMSAHAGKTEDHASIIELLLQRSRQPILAVHDPGEDLMLPSFVTDSEDEEDRPMQSILVPVSLSSDAHPQVEIAAGLARVVPLWLHLLHVLEPAAEFDGRTPDPAAVWPSLEALVPDDLAGRATVHVTTGDTVPAIVRAAREMSVALIVMGEHTTAPVRRWLTHDTARAVLHEAHCPVWYVPAEKAAPITVERFALSNEKSILWGNV
jgi:nucleotide-binding universal stress UspA family protein